MAQNHLLRRGSHYSFRRRVPDDLREALGKKEIKKALGTSDPKEAKRLAHIEALKTEELFERTRREVKPVAPPERRPAIGYDQAFVLVARWYWELEQKSEDWMEENLEIFQNPDALNEALETCHLDELVFSGGGGGEGHWGRRYQGESGKRQLRALLEANGVEFGGDEKEFRRLAGVVRKSLLENIRNDIKRLNRETVANTFLNPNRTTEENGFGSAQVFGSAPAPSLSYRATVGEILDEFASELKVRERAASTIQTYTVPIRFLREMLGEKTVLASVDRDRMKQLRELILGLPANASKFYPGKKLAQCIELAKRDGRPLVARKTVENYFIAIQAVLNFAVRIRKIPFNPGEGVLFLPPQRGAAKKRPPFTIEQLNTLFAAKLYTSNRTAKEGLFWAPLIALFSWDPLERSMPALYGGCIRKGRYLVLQLAGGTRRRLRLRKEAQDTGKPSYHSNSSSFARAGLYGIRQIPAS